ncbi:hypothetical protein EGK75_09115 [Neisseria weixii]|uniref:Phage tail protein n=1 Tax=Neisseria weixii TaxID=1853276 RepID=A0A3N4NDC2_9NEIS|nr:phage tail tube protein [Neisseria weixii]RPD86271.1 hypothetical protein EGK75_09115 [Neisseria weixii]RPD89409.1 hypothetical protein EGK74_04100 [Neisseria weixii]
MSSGAKQVVYFVPEVAIGTTPALAKWKTLPFKTISLDGKVNKTDSDTITDGRVGRGGLPTSMEVSGDLEVNAAYGVYDELLEAAFFNTWNDNALTVGTARKTFSVARGYTDIDVFHIFTGCHLSRFALSIPEEGLITLTFGLAGLNRTQKTGAPVGTISPAVLSEEFTNVGVGELTIDGQSLRGVACVTAFNFELENGLQVQKCLGDGLASGKQLEGKATMTGSFTCAWSPKASVDIYEKQFTNGKLAIKIPFGDAAGNRYELELPMVTVTAELPSGGADDLLQTTVNFTVQDQSPILRRVPKGG